VTDLAAMPRILVVDDHPLYREGMMGALRAELAGVEVVGAGTAEEGLEVLAADPEVDLVLIDLRLPGMDGLSALAAYAARFPAVARLLVSGADEAALVRRAFAAGASGFLPKSMSVAEVSAAIRQVLAGGVYVPGASAVPPAGPGAQLSLRQLEVLRLLGEGYTNKQIARTLDITERTAKAHVAAIFEALAVDNRTQVVAAQRLGYA
jgi:two-component system, NarL family, nitrate/nitrite response regulator NarL